MEFGFKRLDEKYKQAKTADVDEGYNIAVSFS